MSDHSKAGFPSCFRLSQHLVMSDYLVNATYPGAGQ